MDRVQVCVLVDPGQSRRWVKVLGSRLSASLGKHVPLRSSAMQGPVSPLPFEKFDRILHGSPLPDLSAWTVPDEAENLRADERYDGIIIDTVGEYDRGPVAAGATVLSAEINGMAGRNGLLAALAGGPTVGMRIVASKEGERSEVVGTSICIPVRDPIGRFLDTIFARLITLFDAAVRHLLQGRPLPLTAEATERSPDGAEAHYGPARKIEAVARSLAHKMAGPVVRTADWTVGIRRVVGDAVGVEPIRPELLRLLPSDHGHFVADPILLEHEGTTYLFFEEMDHARGIGSLACVTVTEDGSLSAPVPVMERSTHLSYPFVFSHEGQVFMIPETSAERRVELWRATRLPDQWEQCAVLIDDVDAVDATVKYDSDQRLWWMFVSVAEPGGSTFDTLSIYYSEQLATGWTAHPLNPVKLDPRSSRPGGPIIEDGGHWLRPAQDCSKGYGGALSWCRITELTREAFREEVIEHWRPPEGYRGLHTYTRAGCWEAIDLQRRRWRWQRS